MSDLPLTGERTRCAEVCERAAWPLAALALAVLMVAAAAAALLVWNLRGLGDERADFLPGLGVASPGAAMAGADKEKEPRE